MSGMSRARSGSTADNAELTSPTPRRVATPRWFDLRLVLGIVLVLAAVGIGAKVIADARHTDTALALTHDLAAGTTLRTDDLTEVDAQLPDNARLYVTDEGAAVGKVLSRAVTKGELLPAAVLERGPSVARTRVTVPLAADAAPRLSRGQRIVVWVSTAACPSLVLLPDVTVQNVQAADAGTFSSGGTGQDVDLTVPAELAQRVADALGIDNVTLRAGVLSGAPAGSAQLPSLDACSPSDSQTP